MFRRTLPAARTLVAALVLASATLGASPWVDAVIPRAQAAESVRLEVSLVHATRGAASVDKGLSNVQRDLAALPFTAFTRRGGETLKGTVGEAMTADLGDGVIVAVTVQSLSADGATLAIEIKRLGKTVQSTTVTRPWGRAQVMSAGSFEGGMLVVPVLAIK